MKIDTFKCDQCGSMKGQTNHWWAFYSELWGDGRGYSTVIITLDQANESGVDVQHYCGVPCLTQALHKALTARVQSETVVQHIRSMDLT